MIEFKVGNIFAEDAEALVNTVNCVGVMGRGIALQFKNAFPDNFNEYERACHREIVQPGRMFIHKTQQISNPKYIINFPTKRHWRGKSRIEDIESGLDALVGEIKALNICSIAIPPLGSGLGGLSWPEVRVRIERAMRQLPDVRIVIFEPDANLDVSTMSKSKDIPEMTPGRAALVGLVRRYIAALLDPMLMLLEIHKLMYFMQEAGEDLRLKYSKAPYGPYAENLRFLLQKIEGHFTTGYADGGDSPDKQIELVPGAADDAERVLEKQPETRDRFERVVKLVEGFETPFGLELLSTVHWVVSRQNAHSIDDVIGQVHAWGERKKRFSERQIRLALDRLQSQGWVTSIEIT